MTRQSQFGADPAAMARLLLDEEGRPRKGLPPVHLWNPPFCGDMDMRIAADGQWFHEGTLIRRAPLVRLFSSILRREDDGEYYLVTPVEKVRIRVEDAPMVVVRAERLLEDGEPFWRLATLTDDVLLLDAAHPLRVDVRADGEPRPYVRVRDRLDALLHRNVYYQLAEWAEEVSLKGRTGYAVRSAGEWFVLAEGG